MKKLLSLALALALCLSLALPAYAYDMGKPGMYTTVSCGLSHTAAIDANGSLWMWGDNYSGQLGNGGVGNAGTDSHPRQTVPEKIMDDVISVSCGDNHTAALKSDGTLWTWGNNNYGQLGNGTAVKGASTEGCTLPSMVLDDVIAVSCYMNSTFAIRSDHTLWTWGNPVCYRNGKLIYDRVNGTAAYQSVPVQVMEDVVAISGKAALRSDGSLWMWGYNGYGQLGIGAAPNNTDPVMEPVKVMDNVIAVSGTIATTAAIKSDGTLWMWGDNRCGNLGNGTTTNSNVPVKVMDHVVAVSCGVCNGNYATAAIRSDGSLWMWGSVRYGCLGIGKAPDPTSSFSKVPIKIMDHVAAVSTSGMHTVAIRDDGSLWAWGYNRYGQLGNGGIGDSVSGVDDIYQSVPVKVTDNMATFTSEPVPTVAGFSDVYETDYYAGAVEWAKETGVTTGTGDGTTFSPSATVTRAQAMTFLWRAAGSPEPFSTVSPFTDVTDPSAYYYKAVLWAAQQGITDGIGNNKFGLNSTLTYDQILTFLCRAAGEDASGSDWSAAAVNWAKQSGLTDGLSFTAKSGCPRSDLIYCLWKELA